MMRDAAAGLHSRRRETRLRFVGLKLVSSAGFILREIHADEHEGE